MTLEQVFRVIDEVKEELQREEEQAIMQRNMERATNALAGKDACERMRRRFQFSENARRNIEFVRAKRK